MLNFVALIFALLLSVEAATTWRRAEHDYYKYHPMEEITNWMAQMVTDYPGLVTTMDYGLTYEKRTIQLLKIGLESEQKKKAVWLECGIHAREWIAPAFCQYFVKQILKSYKTDSKMAMMMRNMDFYVTPVLNIDGYIYTWKDNTTRLWRKNRSPGPSDECYGTDLNRNFDFDWGTIGISYDCSSDVYCGTQPLSEPEVQAVTYFLGSRKDDVLCFLSIHSYGQMVLVPFGNPNLTAPNYDELMKVGSSAAEAIKKVQGQNYTVGSTPAVLYALSGSSKDWARMLGIPYTYTFELRDKGLFGFQLPEDQIQPTCEEAYEGVLHIITYAHDKTYNRVDASTAASFLTVLSAAGVTRANLW